MIKNSFTFLTLSLSLTLLVSTPPIHCEQTFQEITDLSDLPLLNPDLRDRRSLKLRLKNGLEIYLISDPHADQSSAGVMVKAGSWNDPEEYPGMAHFCEHMLFMGTKTYPNENEFHALVTDNGGLRNAFTAPDHTVYFFSANTNGFLNTFKRFAHFFIDPLFSPSGISRELHAVDQEFAKNVEHDGWREQMVFKETGNPNHPNAKFDCGNSQTLSHIPQSALQQWHEEHYTPDRMRIAIYSSLPLEEIQKEVIGLFSAVPARASAILDIDHLSLTSEQQRAHIVYIRPIQERQTLTLSWELPRALSLAPSKPAELLAFALQRGQTNSLREQLKKEGLIEELRISADQYGGKEHQFFQIQLELTEKGIEQMGSAILRCFQAIAQFKQGVPLHLFQEMNTVNKLHYQFQPRENAFNFIRKIAADLLNEDLTTYPRATLLATTYEKPLQIQLAKALSTDRCLIFLQADPEKTGVQPDREEKWMGSQYSIRPIPDHWLALWRKAKPHPEILTATPNPFLPTEFSFAALEEEDLSSSPPRLFAEDEGGIAYYHRIPEFSSPEAAIYIHLLSPVFTGDSRASALSAIYTYYLSDLLHGTLSAASDAGLQAELVAEPFYLSVRMSGFFDKSPLLLQEICKQLSEKPPTREQFEQYKQAHLKKYANCEKNLAVIQAYELAHSLLSPQDATSQEKWQALQTISYEDFCSFLTALFEKTYLKAIFCGNLTLEEAQSSWLDLRHLIASPIFPKEDHPALKVLLLSQKPGPFAIHKEIQSKGNAVLLLLEQEASSFEKEAAFEILGTSLEESFFTALRTKQKTGYIARATGFRKADQLFQIFAVQSNSHQPEDLLYRFELFLEDTLQNLAETIPPERFQMLRTTLIESFRTRYRNLAEKSALWDYLAFGEDETDFLRIEKKIKGFKDLSYSDFLEIARSFLSRENRQRLAILYQGKLNEPFIYHSVTPSQIQELSQENAIQITLSKEKVNQDPISCP